MNTVNCVVGVMGRGIVQFKNAWPENFHAYANACKAAIVQPGRMFCLSTNQLTNPQYIINFSDKTPLAWCYCMEDIESGLHALVDTIREYDIKSIAIRLLAVD